MIRRDLSGEKNIYIFPCAGGCAANYSEYGLYLPETKVYEYKGHWSRFEEPFSVAMDDLVRDAADLIRCNEYPDGLLLFGHSMGGIVAWHLAAKLLEIGLDVKGIFIAACSPPTEKVRALDKIDSDEDIEDFLIRVRQVPQKVLRSDFFKENLLPTIRNDFRILKDAISRKTKYHKIDCDIICLGGREDSLIQMDLMYGWENFTNGSLQVHEFPGNHFFVYERNNIKKISRLIRQHSL